jgi:hypothetical protein
LIATKRKDVNEIFSYISGEKNVILVGCGLCAKTFKTGGEEQLEEFKNFLKEKNLNVLISEVIEAVCDQRLVNLFINKNKEKVEKSDSIIIFACGAGVQAVKEILPCKKLHPALDTIFLATEKRLGWFYQFCSLCGDCELEFTEGICVKTRCPKGFMNGPCGGSKNGKCEALPKNDCVWNLIFKLYPENFYKKYLKYKSPKNYKKSSHPQKIENYEF